MHRHQRLVLSSNTYIIQEVFIHVIFAANNQMDIVFVFYRFQQDDDAKLNCYQLILQSQNKVLLLIDLLQIWETTNHPQLCPSKHQYSFFSVSGNTQTHLDSPSCCLPVVNKTTQLLLVPSSFSPLTALHQLPVYFHESFSEFEEPTSTGGYSDNQIPVNTNNQHLQSHQRGAVTATATAPRVVSFSPTSSNSNSSNTVGESSGGAAAAIFSEENLQTVNALKDGIQIPLLLFVVISSRY